MEIIAIGSAELMEGFALLGIRNLTDPSADEIGDLLTDLIRRRERALVYVQQDFMSDDIPLLQQLCRQGGSILICEIPSLNEGGNYRPKVEKLISRVLGSAVLERQIEH